MKILVTGGAGFIGSHVCDALLSKGHSVICIDNFNEYYDPNVKEDNIKHNLNNELFKIHRMDICNLELLQEIFEKDCPDKIVHLASRAGVRPSVKNPFLYEAVNVGGTLNLLELARKFNIPQFVFASSSSVYGARNTVPFKESDSVDTPISPYAATKKAGELLCHVYHHLYGIKITCLRFFTVYGPRNRPDMVPLLFANLIWNNKPISMFGDGTSKRDYTFVGDIVKGILSALDTELDYEIINLGNSNPIELKRMINLIESAIGKKANIVQKEIPMGDMTITFADISKAQRLLNYNPDTKIEQGVQKFAEWFLKTKNE